MPSRKPQAADLQRDAGRSSMRRLSSIASLHQLLPFSRNRRSNGETEIPSGSEESLFSASNSAVASNSTETSWTQDSEDGQQTQASSSISTTISRRDDSARIAEKPSSNIPRSRTFSNLPLPLPSRKKQQQCHQTTAAWRGSRSSPIASTCNRVPTPSRSNRRYFPFGNRTAHHSMTGTTRLKLERSDTEPLLTTRLDQDQTYHRSTAFQEDVPTASAKVPPLTPSFEYASSLPRSSPDQLEFKEKSLPLPRDRSFCGALPTTPTKSWHSLANALVDDKTPTQSSYFAATAPIAKHHNALADITNRYQSSQKVAATSLKSSHVGEDTAAVEDPEHNKHKPVERSAPLRVVLEAQPTAYWSGRLSSLLGRYQGQEVEAKLGTSSSMASRFETDKLYAPTASTSRIRRAFEELFSTCATTDAKESFIAFQLQYAALRNEPELAKPVGPQSSRPNGYLTASSKSMTVRTIEEPHRSGGTRKTSFVDRLLGRGKRNSLA